MAKKKKTVLLSKADAISRLDKMIPILYRNIVNAIRIEATMEAGNALIPTLKDKALPGADAFNTIMQSLAFDLAMHLARLYDVGNKQRHVNSRDVASIPLAVRLLRQKRCQKTLIARARNWLPESRGLADVFERDCEKALERVSANYSETFKGRFGRGGLKTLKTFRDIFMAHSLMKELEAKPMYNHLFRLTDSARDFVEDARLAVSGDNLSLKGQERIFLENANEFWRMALLGERHDEWAMNS